MRMRGPKGAARARPGGHQGAGAAPAPFPAAGGAGRCTGPRPLYTPGAAPFTRRAAAGMRPRPRAGTLVARPPRVYLDHRVFFIRAGPGLPGAGPTPGGATAMTIPGDTARPASTPAQDPHTTLLSQI